MNPRFPFESLRDYVAVLEARGLLLRFRGVNQDAYEATAIMYALIDEFGMHEAPAVLFEALRANGCVYPGPLVANTQGHMDTEGGPGSPDRKTTNKAIIDATRQWPEEGGPAFYQELNRTMLERAEPGVIERVKAKWPGKLLAERRF